MLKGDGGNDTITGSGFDDVIWGGSGADTLSGGAGEDTIYGVTPDSSSNDESILEVINSDRIFGGADKDTIISGDGDDYIFADFEKAEDIDGLEGDDVVWAGGGADYVVAGGGKDRVWGESGNDTVYGQGGNDFIYGGSGNDALYGEAGEDIIYGVTDSSELNAEANNGRNRDTLFGGSGDDIVHGGDGDDYIAGGESFADGDLLFGHDGSDSFDWQIGDGLHLINGGFLGQTGTSNGFNDKLVAQGYQRAEGGIVREQDAGSGEITYSSAVTDQASADYVLVSANGDDVQIEWQSSLEGTTILDLVGIASLSVDLGDGSDVIRFDDLRDTTLADSVDREGNSVPAITVALGSTRSVNLEERDEYDSEGIATGEKGTFLFNAKALDSVFDKIEILGEGGVDEFILTTQPLVDLESGTGVEVVDVAQTGGVTFRVQEVTRDRDQLIIDAGDGEDIIDASGMDREVFENVWLVGGNDDDSLTGSVFSERLLGGSGSDRIEGGLGVDIFYDATYAELATEFIDGKATMS